MDLLTAAMTLFTACSVHPDEQLIRALVQEQSGGHPFYLLDRTDLAGTDSARSREDAMRLLGEQLDKGHRMAIGPLLVPLEWAESYNRSTADLWDICTNMAVATAKLSEFDWGCQRPRGRRRVGGPGVTSTTRRACVVRRFARELGMPNAWVISVLRRVLAPPPRAMRAPSAGAPEVDSGWGTGFPTPAADPSRPAGRAWPPPLP